MGWKLTGGKAPTPNEDETTRKGSSENRPFDEEIIDQFKKNVHRPPKGCQNWFDAWPSDEEDEDDEDEDEDESDDDVEKMSEKGRGHGHTLRNLEPTLPQVDDFRGTTPDNSHRKPPPRSSHKDLDQPTTPIRVTYAASQRRVVQAGRRRSVSSMYSVAASVRTKNFSPVKSRVDSPDIDHAALRARALSALSDYSIDASLPDIRASIMVDVDDDRTSVVFGSASTVDLSRLPAIKPLQVAAADPVLRPSYSLDNFSWSSSTLTELQNEPLSPDEFVDSSEDPPSATRERTTPKQSLYNVSHRTDTVPEAPRNRATSRPPVLVTGSSRDPVHVPTCDDPSSNPTGQASVGSAPASESGHLVMVSEEEMALLKAMRQRSTIASSPSFSETIDDFPVPAEQSPLTPSRAPPLRPKSDNRPVSRKDSAKPSPIVQVETSRESKAQHASSRGESYFDSNSSTTSSVTSVDEIEISTPVRACHSPPRPKDTDTLPATTYSPSEMHKRSCSWEPPMRNEKPSQSALAETQKPSPEVQRRVETFIATKGAPPPLNVWIKTTAMRRENPLVPPVTDAQELPMPRAPLKHPRIVSQVSPPGFAVPPIDAAASASTPDLLNMQGRPHPNPLAQDPRKPARNPMTRFSKVPMPNPLKSHPVEPSGPTPASSARKDSSATTPESISAAVRRLPWDTGPVITPASASASRNPSYSSHDSREPDQYPLPPLHSTNDWMEPPHHQQQQPRSKSRGRRSARRGNERDKRDGSIRTITVDVEPSSGGRRRGLSVADNGGMPPLAPGLDPWHVLAGRAVRESKSYGGGLSGMYHQQQGKGSRTRV